MIVYFTKINYSTSVFYFPYCGKPHTFLMFLYFRCFSNHFKSIFDNAPAYYLLSMTFFIFLMVILDHFKEKTDYYYTNTTNLSVLFTIIQLFTYWHTSLYTHIYQKTIHVRIMNHPNGHTPIKLPNQTVNTKTPFDTPQYTHPTVSSLLEFHVFLFSCDFHF